MHQFASIDEVLERLARGEMVVVMDDEGRENEGDLVFAADFVTPEKINFLATHCRGLICVPLSAERSDALNLYPMTRDPHSATSTAFTVSVDARTGITTGISAADRARTIQILNDPASRPSDLAAPGHIFPLRAREGGVLTRAGHTEAAVDLARLSHLTPAGVICEIMNEDGTMARTAQLVEFAKRHGVAICTIEDLIEYRARREKLIELSSQATIPTQMGTWTLRVYGTKIDRKEHVALSMGPIGPDPVLVRVHSECLTGDVFGSERCDCGTQLRSAMRQISQAQQGVVLYMRQEGRGIGLMNKIRAYHLQESGFDTVEANRQLGFSPDLREYGIGAQILSDLGVKKMRLLTNNPRKIVGLEGYGIEMVERVPIQVTPTETNSHYLQTKKDKLGHLLDLPAPRPQAQTPRS